jgi:hypothetical protein
MTTAYLPAVVTPNDDVALPVPRYDPLPARRLEHVMSRGTFLQNLNAPRRPDMLRIRAIEDGGAEAMIALLGPELEDVDEHERLSIPAANLILSGTERAAHRLGIPPDLRCDPRTETDDEKPRIAAEKRERIVEALDELAELVMMLPQLARWLIGYGFAPVVVTDHWDADGNPYPDLELRDPFECWPGAFGPKQQPRECAFMYRMDPADVVRKWPWARDKVLETARNWTAPAWMPTPDAYQRWDQPTKAGIAVVEYHDVAGITTYSPQCNVILDHIANPVRGRPTFHIFKRFSFNRPQGQFDQSIGLMASIAKVNLLAQIAMEEGVLGETNVFDSTADAGDYVKGRDAVNVLDTNARVEKPVASIPFQLFQHVQILERMLRTTSRYNVQDDGESPTSWATGKGLDSLSAGTNAELDELRTVLKHGLQKLDSLRLEYDEASWPDLRKPLVGERKGVPFAEEYTPAKDVGGVYRTKRIYGAMAGWDDATKIVTGLQLRQAGSLSNETFMSNITGLDNITKELKRIENEKTKELLDMGIAARVQQGDVAAIQVLVERLPEGETKDAYLKLYAPPEQPAAPPGMEGLPPELAAMMGGGPMPALPPGQPPEDVATVLTRLQMNGGAEGGVQTVGRL